ncbi:MAG: OsmC family protein, partial [Acidimicrobiales bacterium]
MTTRSTIARRRWRPGLRATTTTTATDGGSRSVEATWEGAYRCRVQAGDFELVIDEPVSAGGGGDGPQPTEVFLASLASCMTLAIYHVARKRGMELPDLVVRATGDYDGPKFVALRVEVQSSLAADQLGPGRPRRGRPRRAAFDMRFRWPEGGSDNPRRDAG